MRSHDLSRVLKHAPLGAWVALSSDKSKVVAHAETYSAAVRAAQRVGENNPVLVRTPQSEEGAAATAR